MKNLINALFVWMVVVTTVIIAGGAAATSDEEAFPQEGRVNDLLAKGREVRGVPREKLLEQAVKVVRRSAGHLAREMNSKRTGKTAGDEAMIKWFAARLCLSDIVGMQRSRSVIARMKLSVETDDERKKLRDWMGQSVKMLDEIEEDVREKIGELRSDPTRQVNAGSKLQQIRRKVYWQRAFVRYWYARAAPAGPEQKRRFDDAISDAGKLINNISAGPQKRRLKLLKASCWRGMGRYKKAEELLSQLMGDTTERNVLFEMALVKIDRAAELADVSGGASPPVKQAFRDAGSAVADYQHLAPDSSSTTMISVRSMMLHERLGRAESRVGQKARERACDRLDRALREFLHQYVSSSVRAPVGHLFRRHWPQGEMDSVPGAVLAVLAVDRMIGTRRRLADRGMASLSDSERSELRRGWEKAVRLCERVKQRETKEEGNPSLMPVILWTLGNAQRRLGATREAADAFEDLSTNYPTYPRAKSAAVRRMRICRQMLDSAVSQGGELVREAREKLADALSILLSNWGQSEKADRWRLALGWQCAVLADDVESDEVFRRWSRRAIKAYDAVEAGGHRGMRAHFLSLRQQYRLARRITPEGQADVIDLAERLSEFSGHVKEKAGNTSTVEDGEREMQWAAWSEFYSLVLKHSVVGVDEVLGKLSNMKGRWGECEAVREADGYLLDHAFRDREFEKADELLGKYTRDYGVAQGWRLARRFLLKVRDHLESSAKGHAGQPEKRLYSRWALWLYQNTEKGTARFDVAAKFYADALRRQDERDAVEKALDLYERLITRGEGRGNPEEPTTVDVELRIGKAKCLKALNRSDAAIAVLTPLCSGLPRGSELFWEAHIERAECIARSDDVKTLRKAKTLIRQLRGVEPDFGGGNIQHRFERLQSAVSKKMRKAGKSSQ